MRATDTAHEAHHGLLRCRTPPGRRRFDARGGIRTHDLRLRRPTLYPAELRARLYLSCDSVRLHHHKLQPPVAPRQPWMTKPPASAVHTQGASDSRGDWI